MNKIGSKLSNKHKIALGVVVLLAVGGIVGLIVALGNMKDDDAKIQSQNIIETRSKESQSETNTTPTPTPIPTPHFIVMVDNSVIYNTPFPGAYTTKLINYPNVNKIDQLMRKKEQKKRGKKKLPGESNYDKIRKFFNLVDDMITTDLEKLNCHRDKPNNLHILSGNTIRYINNFGDVWIKVVTEEKSVANRRKLLAISNKIAKLKHENVIDVMKVMKFSRTNVKMVNFVETLIMGPEIAEDHFKTAIRAMGTNYEETEDLIRRYARDVLSGLSELHRLGIALLNLDTGSISGYSVSAKVVFKISRLTDCVNHTTLLKSGRPIRYCTKEERSTKSAGTHSDVFMFGMILADLGVMKDGDKCIGEYEGAKCDAYDYDDFYRNYEFNKNYSYAIRDFMALCLTSDVSRRPDVNVLLSHAFIKGGELRMTEKRKQMLDGKIET
ncbi:hypothetical protein ECANGB1_795 [Enterospora canceri]|uniref:Protein kinase domain-containing protein n=1 Tax=Enterospora canceri TaxID=1081671 RepID=A0A1Y1S7H4_9MICR|nr:hypothetical protein ECANGB1_795 [Enterospora canceri]